MEKSISQIIKDVEEITVCENSKNPLRDERIVLNVGGIKYETCRSTLTAYPDTLLGTMFHQRNKEMLHPTNGNEYFIDRNGYAFYYILEFYRTGRILWKDDMLNTSLFPLITPQSIETDNNFGSMSNIDINTGNINNNNNNHNSNDNLNNCDDNNRQLPNHFVPHLNHISLLDLEDEFNYFQIPYTSKHDLAEKAAGKLLDDFAYAIEELICLAISKLIDRIAITFYRDGSKVECKLIDNHNNGYHHNSNLLSTKYFNASGSSVGSGGSSNGGGVDSGSNGSGSNNNNNDVVTNGVNDNNINHNNNNSSSISVNNINNDNNDNSDSFNSIYGNFKGNIVRSKVSNNFSDNCYYFHRLNDYSLNGYCIVNHFYDDIKKYLESNFPNMIIKLDFGSNYKSLTLSMSHLFTRDTIKKHSKIGMLKDQKE